LFKGEYVKKFMILKRVNLVDDPANGNLKSVFILKKGEKKLIDGRAKQSLASRFEYKTRTKHDGTILPPIGFMKFDLIEGDPEEVQGKAKTFQVGGNDIEYFEEDSQPEQEEVKLDGSECEVCGKVFATEKALKMHKLSHKE
jgi:Zinc finger, C2H2 type.